MAAIFVHLGAVFCGHWLGAEWSVIPSVEFTGHVKENLIPKLWSFPLWVVLLSMPSCISLVELLWTHHWVNDFPYLVQPMNIRTPSFMDGNYVLFYYNNGAMLHSTIVLKLNQHMVRVWMVIIDLNSVEYRDVILKVNKVKRRTKSKLYLPSLIHYVTYT